MAGLVFPAGAQRDQAIMAILAGSLLAGAVGMALLALRDRVTTSP